MRRLGSPRCGTSSRDGLIPSRKRKSKFLAAGTRTIYCVKSRRRTCPSTSGARVYARAGASCRTQAHGRSLSGPMTHGRGRPTSSRRKSSRRSGSRSARAGDELERLQLKCMTCPFPSTLPPIRPVHYESTGKICSSSARCISCTGS